MKTLHSYFLFTFCLFSGGSGLVRVYPVKIFDLYFNSYFFSYFYFYFFPYGKGERERECPVESFHFQRNNLGSRTFWFCWCGATYHVSTNTTFLREINWQLKKGFSESKWPNQDLMNGISANNKSSDIGKLHAQLTKSMKRENCDYHHYHHQHHCHHPYQFHPVIAAIAGETIFLYNAHLGSLVLLKNCV